MPQRPKQTPKTHLPKYCRIQILETRDNRIRSTRCKLSYWKTTPQNSTSLSHNLQEEIHPTVGGKSHQDSEPQNHKSRKTYGFTFIMPFKARTKNSDRQNQNSKQITKRKEKKQERKRWMQLTSRRANPTATAVQKSIKRLEFLDVDAEICARNPKTNKTETNERRRQRQLDADQT